MAGQSKVSRQRHKDKKVVIYRAGDFSEPGSMPVTGYKPIHPSKLWAYVRQLSGQERYAAMSVQVDEEMLFVVNWRQDLIRGSRSLYIEHNGTWYDITRVDTFEGYKEDLQLYGKALLQPPDESEILPYGELP